MAVRAFDKKFGQDLLKHMSTGPGVYLFRNAEAQVIYVGKAKNLRRRLQSYRNASRKRLHRKMRLLVRNASTLEVQPAPSEEAALLNENALIQALRPTYNVDGAYAFLYPAIGIRPLRRQTLLAFSTEPEAWDDLGLQWYGVFRSRPRAREGYDALVELLALLGHREPPGHLPTHPPRRGCRLVGIRQLPSTTLEELAAFLAGHHGQLLSTLALDLLGKPRARREAPAVQANLQLAQRFFKHDCARLRSTLQTLGLEGTFVPQAERDALFIRARSKQA